MNHSILSSQWVYQRSQDPILKYEYIRFFGGFVHCMRDFPMRFGNEDSGLNYWDYLIGNWLTVIHGRGYGYSIWLFLLLITITREPFRVNVSWNPA